MPQAAPHQHVKLVVQDDGTLSGNALEQLEAWFSRLRRAAQAAVPTGVRPHVLIASHGGLVDQPAGEEFAARIPEVMAGEWSVTFITRTGFLETIGQELRRVCTEDVLGIFGALVGVYRALDLRYLLPGRVMSPEAAGTRPGRYALMESTPWSVPSGEAGTPPRSRRFLAAYVTADPEPLPEDAQRKVEALTGELTALLVQRVPQSAHELPHLLQAAARDVARMSPASGPTSATLDALPGVKWAPVSASPLQAPHFRVHFSRTGTLGRGAHPQPQREDLEQIHMVEALVDQLEVGKALWKSMKDRTGDLFLDGRPGMEVLDRLFRSSPVEVHVLGHSLGGIFVDHALRAVARRGYVNFLRSVFYLAPANTLTFHAETQARIEEHLKRSRVKFHCLGLTAEEERSEVGQGVVLADVYPRTILYLISNALEGQPHTPLLGMQRYFTAESFPEDAVVAWTPDPPGLDHTTHGDFIHNAKVRDWIRRYLGRPGGGD